MIEIRRLSDCSINEAVTAWNIGFEGYFFDASTTPEKFVARMAAEGLSPDLSIVAFAEGKPIGIVKSGIREFRGRKIAWNGGTGVAAAWRSKGVGRMLIDESIKIYKEEGVQLATLEAISENSKAIALYEKLGYQKADSLEYLELKGCLEQNPVRLNNQHSYLAEYVYPQEASSLSFYKGTAPWQTSWQNAKDGEALIALDNGSAAGYAVFRKGFTAEGRHAATTLFQIQADPGRKDWQEIITFLLTEIFGDFSDEIRRVIPNFPVKDNRETYELLSGIGFTPAVKQVYMIKELS
ncbi:GNAT family N-acetyltransferase [Bacillus sp. AG4(2022)]|uniref:GNAT family N-acetyltransferase n=1 Tax=Bacillus sp. AG4(2022) TaxID=2962594 RepID=UPI002881056C|nr:GNAT family N-acetyltransferase [Bacillus sp. AG4(2022)]MDT0162536.1 GNAT family N-acetyltransferase [Bacillus sp. AG4(2022)]